ncbi:Acyltransferase [Selenomonas sp. oral taxon 892 str. F0426]|uniref:lysophospholipid acyltransferase family protein n=1 Tax=Selenomonas sp. oral taxon 892 TaxID=1321785 RepID=UPI0003AD6514|nr:lysophospholipid acyltransferase family protein [Selenomonas sp. oral taxon 892]ERJ92996.1 Acyltransferase [Selenomonas sp. oral taxon 892 str. F0426]
MLYGFLRFVFRLIFYILFRTRVYGRENIPAEGAVILAANHASNIDPPLMASLIDRPVSYMAKIELFENPIFGAAIRRCHAFPVKRGESDRGAIKTAVTVLKEERVLGLFPEGTRSKTGELQKAEAGVALIAAMTGAPIVPVAILNTHRIFANGGLLPQLRIKYGQPISFQGDRKSKEALDAFSAEIMAHIARMKEELGKK